jgi:2-keto-4-pentenoate hydratase/2-oxohepta-3-ene-1,7-dioic acid hydratase in catechol pathway
VRNGSTRVGIVSGELILDLQDAVKNKKLAPASNLMTIDEILASGKLSSLTDAYFDQRKAHGVPIDSVRFRNPIFEPEKILLMAENYRSHRKEMSASDRTPTEPYLFTKFRNTLIGPGDPVLIPTTSKKVDWEVELAVVIGKPGKNISKKNAGSYVAGYTVANDISFRDWQFSTRLSDGNTRLGLNWVKGKGMDASFPIGPWLVTSDEVPNPNSLRISLTVNGKRKQDSNTSDMIFGIDSIIEYASKGMTLKPGDIISTGTPSGVAASSDGPYLADGDVLEGTVERIGTLRNPVRLA